MQYDNPAQKDTITITGIETKQMEFGMKTVIKTEKKKFIFFDKKKDGTETTASKQFRELGIGVGRTIGVGYSLADKIYSKGGQDIPYEERRILFFETEAPRQAERTTSGMEPAGFEERMKRLEAQVKEQGDDIEEINKHLQSLKNQPVELKDTLVIDEVPF